MPVYDLKCEDCENVLNDYFLSFEDSFENVKCPKCQGKVKNMSFGGIGTVFKGASWATKNQKFKDHKKALNKKLEKKQHEEHSKIRLVPNIAGEEVDSFADAAKIAKEAGYDPSGYEKYAQEEKKLGRYEKPN